MTGIFVEINEGPGCFVATAIHDGHQLRDELHPVINLDTQERLREEDPFTALWAEMAKTSIIGKYSRFEVDLNRPREKAVYIKPEDAWGLEVWKVPLPEDIITRSIQKYEEFYSRLKKLFDKKIKEDGGILVYDFHSYNHKREGSTKPGADPALNPEINLGTENINIEKFDPVVKALIKSLSSFNYKNRTLDVRENIKFKGGYFSKWIYDNYPDNSCVIAIEIKKFFMDEWTGIPDYKEIKLLKTAFEKSVPDVLQVFKEALKS
ncbi:MAG: N-formylglutamate amidohydrolase [Bacteroidia bacterium]